MATRTLTTSATCRGLFGRRPEDPFTYEDLLASVHPDDRDRMMATYPFCRLSGPANVLIMPAIHSASISTKLLMELGGANVIGPMLVGLDRSVQIVPLSANDAQLVNMAAIAAFNVSG